MKHTPPVHTHCTEEGCSSPLEKGQHALCNACTAARGRPTVAKDLDAAKQKLKEQLESLGLDPS
jgi:hypothetical protein